MYIGIYTVQKMLHPKSADDASHTCPAVSWNNNLYFAVPEKIEFRNIFYIIDNLN